MVILLDPIDLQLLEKRRLPGRFRRLSMVGSIQGRVVLIFVTNTKSSQREIIRKYIPSFVFHIFNWTFISFIQSILLFAIAAPTYTLLLTTQFEPDLSSADIAFVAIELGLILTEYIADQQQWGMNSSP